MAVDRVRWKRWEFIYLSNASIIDQVSQLAIVYPPYEVPTLNLITSAIPASPNLGYERQTVNLMLKNNRMLFLFSFFFFHFKAFFFPCVLCLWFVQHPSIERNFCCPYLSLHLRGDCSTFTDTTDKKQLPESLFSL